MEPVVTVEEVNVSFDATKSKKDDEQVHDGRFYAVKDVSFSLNGGECLGLIGQNGSGKSTLQRAIMGLQDVDSGVINTKKGMKVGYVHGESALFEHLTLLENIELMASLNGVSKEDFDKRLNEIESVLRIKDFLNVRPNDASSGMKQKANLARSMIHGPELLILDEPTSAVDIVGVEMFERFIEFEKKNNKGIILTSHYPHEISSLCNKLVILERGEAIFNDEIDKLRCFETDELFIKALRKQVFGNVGVINEEAA